MNNSSWCFYIFLVCFFIQCNTNDNAENRSRKYSTSEIDSMLLKAEMLSEKGDFNKAILGYEDVVKHSKAIKYNKDLSEANIEIYN